MFLDGKPLKTSKLTASHLRTFVVPLLQAHGYQRLSEQAFRNYNDILSSERDMGSDFDDPTTPIAWRRPDSGVTLLATWSPTNDNYKLQAFDGNKQTLWEHFHTATALARRVAAQMWTPLSAEETTKFVAELHAFWLAASQDRRLLPNESIQRSQLAVLEYKLGARVDPVVFKQALTDIHHGLPRALTLPPRLSMIESVSAEPFDWKYVAQAFAKFCTSFKFLVNGKLYTSF